jgi:hypothetical protein
LIGKVKSVEIFIVNIKHEINPNTIHIVKGSKILFNRDGKLIAEIDSNSSSKYVYAYNKSGQKISKTEEWFNGKIITKDTFLYDGKGRMHLHYLLTPKGDWAPTEYIYDKAGNLVVKDMYKFDRDDTNKHLINWFKYDKRRTVIEDSSSSLDNQMSVKKHKYIYDSLRNLKEKITFSENGNVDTRDTIVQYDKHQNILTLILFDKNGSAQKTEYHKYIYDIKGNWVSDSLYVNDSLIKITNRRFEYF